MRTERDPQLVVEKKDVDFFVEKLEDALEHGSKDIYKIEKIVREEGKPEYFLDPRLLSIAKRAIARYVSDYLPPPGHFVFLMNTIRFFREAMHVSASVIDHDVVVAAQTGLENATNKLLNTRNTKDVSSLTLWIRQLEEDFNAKPHELTLEEQLRIVPLLFELVMDGDAPALNQFFSVFHIHDIDIPDMEMSEPDQDRERKNREATFKQREEMSEAGAVLDFRAGDETREDFAHSLWVVTAGRSKNMSLEMSESLKFTGDKYLERWKRAEDLFVSIKKRHSQTSAGEDLGTAYFKELTGFDSSGEIEIYQRETSFVFEFYDSADYDAFIEKKFGSEESVKPSAGRHCQPNTLAYDDQNLDVSVILIDASGGSYNKKRIFDHERHHSIDSVIGIAEQEQASEMSKRVHLLNQEKIKSMGVQWTLEQAGGKIDRTVLTRAASLVRLKKELMAYLVDGTNPRSIPDILRSPTYTDIFKIEGYVVEDFKQASIETLKKICIFTSEVLAFDRRPDARQRLAYHLKDIPFNKILSYLEELQEYRLKWQKGFRYT